MSDVSAADLNSDNVSYERLGETGRMVLNLAWSFGMRVNRDRPIDTLALLAAGLCLAPGIRQLKAWSSCRDAIIRYASLTAPEFESFVDSGSGFLNLNQMLLEGGLSNTATSMLRIAGNCATARAGADTLISISDILVAFLCEPLPETIEEMAVLGLTADAAPVLLSYLAAQPPAPDARIAPPLHDLSKIPGFDAAASATGTGARGAAHQAGKNGQYCINPAGRNGRCGFHRIRFARGRCLTSGYQSRRR
jgi:hypothetical protein